MAGIPRRFQPGRCRKCKPIQTAPELGETRNHQGGGVFEVSQNGWSLGSVENPAFLIPVDGNGQFTGNHEGAFWEAMYGRTR
ncbi:protein of unknown function [Methylocaldum szegediense]|uniref:Uncharacterized protein n=1 Tax=Methylocaldum szegediense TaxID=73780 RepID=A0ABN8X9W1_9GAMM|nr:protein of unknown function [Methylocaldum szegediense]